MEINIRDIHGLTRTVFERAGRILRDLETSSGAIDRRIGEIGEDPLTGNDSSEVKEALEILGLRIGEAGDVVRELIDREDWVPYGELDERYVPAARPVHSGRRNRRNLREFLDQVKIVTDIVNEVIHIAERAIETEKRLSAILELPGVACHTTDWPAPVSAHAAARDLRQNVERFWN